VVDEFWEFIQRCWVGVGCPEEALAEKFGERVEGFGGGGREEVEAALAVEESAGGEAVRMWRWGWKIS